MSLGSRSRRAGSQTHSARHKLAGKASATSGSRPPSLSLPQDTMRTLLPLLREDLYQWMKEQQRASREAGKRKGTYVPPQGLAADVNPMDLPLNIYFAPLYQVGWTCHPDPFRSLKATLLLAESRLGAEADRDPVAGAVRLPTELAASPAGD